MNLKSNRLTIFSAASAKPSGKPLIAALFGLLLALAPVLGVVAASDDPQQVFLTASNRLTFVDLLTGDMTDIAVNGDHFTVVRSSVIYYDRAHRRVVVATPDGRLLPHAFIQPAEGVNRIDWHVAPDEQTIAWTATSGEPSALTTQTWVAGIDGEDARMVFSDGPRDGIRAYPVAFNSDKSLLYMDYQPDTIGDLTPFRQYAGLFALDLLSGETHALPGEPGCFCGAGIGANTLLRMTAAPGGGGFNLRIRGLNNGTETTLPPINNDTQGGDVLIAPDGSRAVYALAQINGFGTAAQSVQTVIVLVDLLNLTQYALTAPSDRLLRPVAWTEDDSAVLLTDPAAMTTWKVTVRDGALEAVANGLYLGTLAGG